MQKITKTSLLFRVAPLIPQNGNRILWEPFCYLDIFADKLAKIYFFINYFADGL
jgi:hypothetical protein